jgi:histidyl-tRNA synthetase
MMFEHEIPSGSRLYFGESAKLKREIESTSATLLENLGFSEITTPLFSYHQHEGLSNSNLLIRVNDTRNSQVSLRADATVDVVRIVTKRLSRSEDVKKWFYIQPIFAYPTTEQYQIGAETIEGSFSEAANIATKLLETLELNYNFQIANISIAHILVDQYGFDLDDIKNIRLEKILQSSYPWIEALVGVETLEDLSDLSIYPEDIARELQTIVDAAQKIESNNLLISPLYYAPIRYYNSLVFRAFRGEKLLATGGIYNIKDINGAGFAVYTDTVIAKKMQRV